MLEQLLRGDFKSRMDGYKSAIESGVLTPNEARRKENNPPLKGGDALRIPANMAVIGADGVPVLPSKKED